MNAAEFAKIQKELEFSDQQLATALRLKTDGARKVRNMKAGSEISGPISLLMELFIEIDPMTVLDDHLATVSANRVNLNKGGNDD